MKIEKNAEGKYEVSGIEKHELSFLRNLIIITENPCKYCAQNSNECTNICNTLVREIDEAIDYET